jgi:uncharacterized protein YwgA
MSQRSLTSDASLAAFVKRLSDAHVPIAGRKAFQKLLFFAQECGWPTSFDYRLHLYGPYSDEAATALDVLSEEGVLNITAEGKISAGAHLNRLAETVEITDEAQIAMDRVIAAFGQEEPRSLELLATLMFVWNAQRRIYGNAVDEQVVKKVQKYKGPKYSDAQISESLGRLKELGFAI